MTDGVKHLEKIKLNIRAMRKGKSIYCKLRSLIE